MERALGAKLGQVRAAMGRMLLDEVDAVRLAEGVGKTALVAAELVRLREGLGKGRKR